MCTSKSFAANLQHKDLCNKIWYFSLTKISDRKISTSYWQVLVVLRKTCFTYIVLLQALGLHVHGGHDDHDHDAAIVVENYVLKMLTVIAGMLTVA